MTEKTYFLGVKALIKNDNNKYLMLVKQSKSQNGVIQWDLPGGRNEHDEILKDTLIREVSEEIGEKSINIKRHLGTFVSDFNIPIENKKSIGLILTIFLCSIDENSKIKLSNEHSSYDWVTKEELIKNI